MVGGEQRPLKMTTSYDKGDFSQYESEADKPPAMPTDESIKAAQAFYDQCCAPLDERGEIYLKSRGIDPARLPDGVVLSFTHTGGHDAPIGAGLAFVGTYANDVGFLQVLYLNDDGTPVIETLPKTKRQQKRRRNIGVQTGAPAVMPGGGGRVLLCEGVEDALIARQATGFNALACFGTSGLAYAPQLGGNLEIVILADNDAPGAHAAEKAAIRYAQRDSRTVRMATPKDPHKDVNDLFKAEGAAAVMALVNGAAPYAGFIEPREEPLPLGREPTPADPYPVDALGPLIGGAVLATVDLHQCPVAIAAGSALGVSALAVQGHIDISHPITGEVVVTSLALVEAGVSSERKSSADKRLSVAIKEHEASLRLKHKKEMAAYNRQKRLYEIQVKNIEKEVSRGKIAVDVADDLIEKLGAEPEAPFDPSLTCNAPTPQGLIKKFMRSGPSQGVMSDEAGSFIGSTAFSVEKKAESCAYFNQMIDGAPLRRTLASDEADLHGRRTSFHLMIQPIYISSLFSDHTLVSSGFTARLLASYPTSTIGTRMEVGRKHKANNGKALDAFNGAIKAALDRPMPLRPETNNELNPRLVFLSKPACKRFIEYHDGIERELGPEGALGQITGFGGKLGERVLRLAGVMAGLENLDVEEISLEVLERAIKLANYYANEMVRLHEMGTAAPVLEDAKVLLEWLHAKWSEKLVGLKAIYQYGPSKLRDKAHAEKAVGVLVDHGWLVPYNGKDAVVNGSPVQKAWHIRRGA
jgi:hypothetical protein